MKKAIVVISLMFLLLGMTVMDAAATDVVVLMCQENIYSQVPVTRVEIVACSKSSGVSRACPTDPTKTNCAQVLSNYLSDGLVIKNIQSISQDTGLFYRVIYTLIRN